MLTAYLWSKKAEYRNQSFKKVDLKVVSKKEEGEKLKTRFEHKVYETHVATTVKAKGKAENFVKIAKRAFPGTTVLGFEGTSTSCCTSSSKERPTNEEPYKAVTISIVPCLFSKKQLQGRWKVFHQQQQ